MPEPYMVSKPVTHLSLRQDGHGVLRYVPRIGEVISKNENNVQGVGFEVTMVIHPVGEDGGDIFVRPLGNTRH